MAWIAPTIVSTGDLLTAASWNQSVVENWNTLGGAWTSFTPSWTNLSVGTGGAASNTGAYANAGKLYIVRVRAVLGTSGASVGTNPELTLPNSSTFSAGALAAANTLGLGIATMLDSGVQTYWGVASPSASTKVQIRLFNSSGTYLATSSPTATAPFTWGAADEVVMQFMYEAA